MQARCLEAGAQRRCRRCNRHEGRACSKRAWQAQIESGRILHAHDIQTMGQKGLSAWLRAMDVKLNSALQRDGNEMREMLLKRLRDMNTDQWSVASKAQKS